MDLGTPFLVSLIFSDKMKVVPLNYNRSCHLIAHDLAGDHLAAHRQGAVKRAVYVSTVLFWDWDV